MSKRTLNTSTTYTLAHSAQCKLKLAANRPDRNLRFVLGHAFTLDNLMLRIVEIENQSAKSAFQVGAKRSPSRTSDEHYDPSNTAPHQEEHFDCTASAPHDVEPSARGRRISFQDNNARPSHHNGSGIGSQDASPSPARKRSPPPKSMPSPRPYLDEGGSDDTSSSDDYEDPASYLNDHDAAESEAKVVKRRPHHDAYSDEEDAALELADDELDDSPDAEMDGLSLQRFESASAKPPRMIRSTSSSSDEDDDGPVSPPQIPADLDVRQLMEGNKDGELMGLYESVRRCRCHGQTDEVGGTPTGMWDVPAEKSEGRHLALISLAT